MASATFGDKSGPGGVVYNPASPYAREMAKWEMGYSPFGQPGRPREQVGFQEYPAMFYLMKRKDTNGEFVVVNMQEAADETEARNLESRGYRQGRPAAIEHVKALEQEIAVASAERNYRDRNMSDKAKAEAARADDASAQHVPDVPVTPIRPRGRPRKDAA